MNARKRAFRYAVLLLSMAMLFCLGFGAGMRLESVRARYRGASFRVIVHTAMLARIRDGDISKAQEYLWSLLFQDMVTLADPRTESSIAKMILSEQETGQVDEARMRFKSYVAESGCSNIFREIATGSEIGGNLQWRDANEFAKRGNAILSNFLFGAEVGANAVEPIGPVECRSGVGRAKMRNDEQ